MAVYPTPQHNEPQYFGHHVIFECQCPLLLTALYNILNSSCVIWCGDNYGCVFGQYVLLY